MILFCSTHAHDPYSRRRFRGQPGTARFWSACWPNCGPMTVLVVTRLDRLARSTADLLRIAQVIEEKNAGTQSLD